MNCLIAAKALREDNSKEQILHFNWRKNYVSGRKNFWVNIPRRRKTLAVKLNNMLEK